MGQSMRFEPALFWRFVRSCLCGGSRHELATRATSSSLPSVRVGSNASGPVDQFFRDECSRPGPSGNRVDVILFGAGTKGADIAIDVSVVCTETYYPKTFNEAIKKREEDKNAMYKDECEKQQMEFFPFVLGSKGGFGKSAKELWDVLVKKANQIGGRDWRHSWTAMSYSSVWKQKLSIRHRKLDGYGCASPDAHDFASRCLGRG